MKCGRVQRKEHWVFLFVVVVVVSVVAGGNLTDLGVWDVIQVGDVRTQNEVIVAAR
jgi:uncharacterized membrane protein YhaH (DUF805 family)